MLPQFFLSYPLVPGESAPDGIKFDFCDGCRVLFKRGTGEHRVVLSDTDSGVVLEDVVCCDGAKFRSRIRYFVNWNLKIYKDGELIFEHDLCLGGKEVLFTMNTDAIGDTVAWLPYVDKFQQEHGCKCGIIMGDKMIPLFERQYGNITFFRRGMEKTLAPYASFLLGINYACEQNMQRRSYYNTPLHYLVGSDLGFDDCLDLRPPRVHSEGDVPSGKYVCLSVLGSMKCKCWNNPEAISDVVARLKSLGYRVLLVDRENRGLHGAEDFTGDRPLAERAQLFKNAELFIGVSSGLSWLAWACRAKVVLVSGFTEPFNEFYTPYRVQNSNVCHGCWNNPTLTGGERDAEKWCPADRDFECTRKITSKLVMKYVAAALGE